ncbi:MAG: S-layer homology domain-containing protein, partial [Prochloron sp. SP5CPC1]|nr:S-layer homology domain-containing protein [Candidatus Paraprochloron terpiosi SP5CPC1]
SSRQAIRFVDVPGNYWAITQIERTYRMGFLEGFPGRRFGPNQNILRVNALVALASGLNLEPKGNQNRILNYFQDGSAIPNYARNATAAATESNIVVSYPNPRQLNPNRQATRAEIAALVYQALVDAGRLNPVASSSRAARYIAEYTVVAVEGEPTPPPTPPTPSRPAPNQVRELARRLATVEEDTDLRTIYLSNPAFSGGSPGAYGAYWGTAFAGFAYQAETRNSSLDDSSLDDGAFSFGFGLGDPDYVGLEVTVSSFSTIRGDFFDPFGVSFKLHRLLPGDVGIAAGIENLILGDASDGTSSGYGVVGKVFKLKPSTREAFSRLSLSVGVGGGRFRDVNDLDEDTINVFGTLGVQVLEPLSIFADWTGQDLNAGLSFVPFPTIPLVITPVVQDLTGKANDNPRFSISVGGSIQF